MCSKSSSRPWSFLILACIHFLACQSPRSPSLLVSKCRHNRLSYRRRRYRCATLDPAVGVKSVPALARSSREPTSHDGLHHTVLHRITRTSCDILRKPVLQKTLKRVRQNKREEPLFDICQRYSKVLPENRTLCYRELNEPGF